MMGPGTLVRGLVPAELGALLMRAVEAASDALFRDRWVPGMDAGGAREAARRRADAIGLMAERALAAGFGGIRCVCGAEAATTAEAAVGERD